MLIPHNPSKRLHQARGDERHPDVHVEVVASLEEEREEAPAQAKTSGRASALNRNVN